MMNYSDFRRRVINEFRSYLPEPYSGYDIHEKRVSKVNGKKDGFFLMPKVCGEVYGCPTMYFDDMYESYSDSEDFDYVMTIFAQKHREAMEHFPNVDVRNIYDSLKNNVVFQMINAEINRDLLSFCPSRRFLDIAVVYRVIISADKKGVSSFIVTNDMLKKFNLSEEDLYVYALANTEEILPKKVTSLRNSVLDKECDEEEDACWIITDEYGFLGANTLLYTSMFRELSIKYSTDYYILPSSIRELILIPTNVPKNLTELQEMVYQIIDLDLINKEDLLSRKIYKYSLDDDSIRVVA